MYPVDSNITTTEITGVQPSDRFRGLFVFISINFSYEIYSDMFTANMWVCS